MSVNKTERRKPGRKARSELTPNSPKRIIKGYKHNWDTLRVAFIEGINNEEKPDEREYVNLHEMSKRFKVPYNTLKERSTMENWYEQRQQHQLMLAKARKHARIVKLGQESIEFDTENFKVAKSGMKLVMIRLAEISRDISEKEVIRKQALADRTAGIPIDVKDLYSAIYPKDLLLLAQAAQIWQEVGNKAVGADVIKHEISVDIDMDVDIQQTIHTLTQELGRDDPERLAAFMNVAIKSGFNPIDYVQESQQLEAPLPADIEDAELIGE